MAQYELKAYEDLFQDRNDDVTDLHAYYMSQFNLELETGGKNKTKVDTFKYGIEESFDFEVLDSYDNSTINTKSNATEFEIIDEVLDSNINEQNIKDVLFDLNSIEFDDYSYKNDSMKENDKVSINYYETNNDYIDDESLIDELCREDSESCRLSPEGCADDYFVPISNETNLLPSIETAFSKRYCNYNVDENQSVPYNVEKLDHTNGPTISSVEQYSYPNNILYNLDSNNKYSLPDTPTSCDEFNFNRPGRKTSVSESIESDVQSSSYYDENSETLDEDELFVNLDDFGITFEKENEAIVENVDKVHTEKKTDKSQSVALERTCLWEHCYEKYNSQNALVEHIERVHVNTYKGDEFSCFWQDCARARRPFNARYKLLIHMRVHSGHKPNRCHHPGCGKSFSRLENLKIHVRSHTGERPYACPAPHCMKAFSNSSDRAKHQRTHFNARPYACGAAGCGKRYTDPSSLRKHVKSHPHITSVPRTCVPTRPIRKIDEQMVPSSPAKLTTLRCIRDKLTIPRLQRL